ncbi:MAG TPA: DUF1731 domain-containing protein [Anaerolineales bacterium]|nr:DUF1731 domain-containing protein [Anaerolineales bacterium]
MKILIAGSHGMIGSAVTRHLIECGHEVVRLIRQAPTLGEVWWEPACGMIDGASLEGFDGVVNLATMRWPFRWTAKAKEKILQNRLDTNGLLSKSLAACTRKPSVLICASGVGYYPSSGDTILTEDCPAGTSFLSHFDQAAEAATSAASAAGIRLVHLRIPTVIGGTMLKMVGFQAGSGEQWVSWVGRDELASIIEFVLKTDTLSGPVNAVSPNPLRGAEFASAATQALEQKPGGAMPVQIARLVFGEMGEEFMLASRRVQPARLLRAGYRFRFPNLADALRHEKQVVEQDLTPQVAL